MLEAYRQHVEERAKQGIPPLPLDAQQVAALVELLKSPPAGEEERARQHEIMEAPAVAIDIVPGPSLG